MPEKSRTVLEHFGFMVMNRHSEPMKGDIKAYLPKYRNEPSFKKFSNFHVIGSHREYRGY